MNAGDTATPTRDRSVTSYPVRRAYVPGVVYPPEVPGVNDFIDIHCHAHQGQQDALSVAKLASQNGMQGILFKSIVGYPKSAAQVMGVETELKRWSDQEGIKPVSVWAGCSVINNYQPPSLKHVREQLDQGVIAVWMPNVTHANTIHIVGAKPIMWDKDADPNAHTKPMPWKEALKYGHYLLDDKKHLLPEVRDIIHLVADRDVALFFGHATHNEIFAMAEEVEKVGLKRAVIDHPYSPFVDLSIDQMKQLASGGIIMNFTYDELSPLLGVDPKKMYDAIREVGVEHFTLSSDAGDPLFPNSVESMRLISAHMAAFGLNKDEIRRVCVDNPSVVVQKN